MKKANAAVRALTLNPTLAKLAVTTHLYDGAVSFAVLPYATMRVNRAIDEFETQVTKEPRTGLQSAFIILEGYVLDMAFAEGDLRPQANGWRIYWEASREVETTAERWALFELVAGFYMVGDVNTVYTATRDETFDAAEPVREPKADETDPQS